MVPDDHRLVHLQFRRYSGCPICHLQLRGFARRHDELVAAGILEVALFHSDAAALTGYQADLPFAVIADPERRHYREFGVESSRRAIIHPAAWLAAARGWRPGLPGDDGSGHLGMPADFLIAPDGRLLACHYGNHADDQWSIDQLLDLAAAHQDA